MTNSPVKVVRSEITKILTLRSNLTTIAVTVVLAAGFGYLAGQTGYRVLAGDPALGSGGSGGSGTPELSGLGILIYTQIPLIVLGVLVAASEYTGQQIRVSLAAVPGRPLFLTAKATALAVVAMMVALPTVLISCLSAEAGLGEYGEMAWAKPSLFAGATAYLVLMSLLGFALAVLSRNAVVPLVLLIGLTQAGSNVLLQISGTRNLARYLPDLAGVSMFLSTDNLVGTDFLSPAAGGLVLAAWVTALLLAGLLVLNKRDA